MTEAAIGVRSPDSRRIVAPGPETHDEKAQALAQAIAEGKEDVVPRTLLGCVDFKVRADTERRERWATEEWWTLFLGTTERFHLETALQG